MQLLTVYLHAMVLLRPGDAGFKLPSLHHYIAPPLAQKDLEHITMNSLQ
jgi:hypothetical protein